MPRRQESWQRFRGGTADDVLSAFRASGPPLHIWRIILALGLGITQGDLPENVGVRVAWPWEVQPTSLTVHRGPVATDPQIRFALAHALGRLLHGPTPAGETLWYRLKGKDNATVAANLFAVDLLVPKWLMTPYRMATASQVAQTFITPIHTAEYRLNNLV